MVRLHPPAHWQLLEIAASFYPISDRGREAGDGSGGEGRVIPFFVLVLDKEGVKLLTLEFQLVVLVLGNRLLVRNRVILQFECIRIRIS